MNNHDKIEFGEQFDEFHSAYFRIQEMLNHYHLPCPDIYKHIWYFNKLFLDYTIVRDLKITYKSDKIVWNPTIGIEECMIAIKGLTLSLCTFNKWNPINDSLWLDDIVEMRINDKVIYQNE